MTEKKSNWLKIIFFMLLLAGRAAVNTRNHPRKRDFLLS